MTKQQLNVRIADLTRAQIDRIAERQNLTPGEVVMLAVDRMFRSMIDASARPEQGDTVTLRDVENCPTGVVIQDAAARSLVEFPADRLSGAQLDRDWYGNERLEIVKRRA